MDTSNNPKQGGITFNQLVSWVEDGSDLIERSAGLAAFEKGKLDAFWKNKESMLSDKDAPRINIQAAIEIDGYLRYYLISEIGNPSLRFLQKQNKLARTLFKETLLGVVGSPGGKEIFEINNLSAPRKLLTRLDPQAELIAEPHGLLILDREKWEDGWEWDQDFSDIPGNALPASVYRDFFRSHSTTYDLLPNLTKYVLPYSVTFKVCLDEVREEQILAFVASNMPLPTSVYSPLLVGDGEGLALPEPYTTPLSATVIVRADTDSSEELCKAIPELLMPGQTFKSQQKEVKGPAGRVGVFEPTETVNEYEETDRSGLPYRTLITISPDNKADLGLFPEGTGSWELQAGAQGKIEDNKYIPPSLPKGKAFIYEKATAKYSGLIYETALLTTTGNGLHFKVEKIDDQLKLKPDIELRPEDKLTWDVIHGNGSISQEGVFSPKDDGPSSFSVITLTIEGLLGPRRGFYVVPVPLLSVEKAYDLLTGAIKETVSLNTHK